MVWASTGCGAHISNMPVRHCVATLPNRVTAAPSVIQRDHFTLSHGFVQTPKRGSERGSHTAMIRAASLLANSFLFKPLRRAGFGWSTHKPGMLLPNGGIS